MWVSKRTKRRETKRDEEEDHCWKSKRSEAGYPRVIGTSITFLVSQVLYDTGRVSREMRGRGEMLFVHRCLVVLPVGFFRRQKLSDIRDSPAPRRRDVDLRWRKTGGELWRLEGLAIGIGAVVSDM